MVATRSMSAAGPYSMSSTKRSRKQNGKSRQGCSRCKIKRIKCDENRPSCMSCVRTGCQCPGYPKQLRWSNKHEQFQTASLAVTCLGRPKDVLADSAECQISELEHDSTTNQETIDTSVLDSYHDGSDSFLTGVSPDRQLAAPTAWQPTYHISSTMLSGNAEEDTTNASGVLSIFDSQHNLVVRRGPVIPQPLAHIPTLLVEHWFRYVCPMWSVFDSEINYNRQLARTTWTMSEAVFYAMQSMSVACLVNSMPQLIGELPFLRAQAAAAIDNGLSQAKSSELRRVTADLVFAVFALGTSLHWSTSAPTEHPWPQIARELLSTWQVGLSAPDALLHAYFCQALTYWDMLLALGGRGSMTAKVDRRRRQLQRQIRQLLLLPKDNSDAAFDEPVLSEPKGTLLGTRPNSWCGVSKEVIDIFGQVLALCRIAYRSSKDKHAFTLSRTTSALCNISLAHELQRELLAIDFGTLVSMEEAQGCFVQTQDENTPITDLLQTAEAYRQAGLLQLHLAFFDLALTPRKDSSGLDSTDTFPGDFKDDTANNEQSRAKFILALALQLVATLEHIPAESGSRSMHSVLYLSAAAGLRYNACQKPQDGISILSGDGMIPPFSCTSQLNWEVVNARRSVWNRLESLQQSMPQRASQSTLQLVKAVWLEYDSSQLDHSGVHWLDVLTKTGLGTIFG